MSSARLHFAQNPVVAPDIRVDVDVVQVPVSVTRRGIPVKGLTKDDFSIRENGTAQVVQYFWQERDLPLAVGLIVDVSVSQAGLIGKHRETVTKFLREVLGPQDRAIDHNRSTGAPHHGLHKFRRGIRQRHRSSQNGGSIQLSEMKSKRLMVAAIAR